MDDRRDISRRQAIKTVAIGGTVLGGAAWIAPSVVTTFAAQAADGAGSGSTTTTSSSTTTTTQPSQVLGTTVVPPDGGDGGRVLEALDANQPNTAAQGTLPFTGMNVFPVAGAGLTMIAGGAAIAAAAQRPPAEAPVPTDD
jgi:hypothetical protein